MKSSARQSYNFIVPSIKVGDGLEKLVFKTDLPGQENPELRQFVEQLFEERKVWIFANVIDRLRQSGVRVASIYTVKRSAKQDLVDALLHL